MGLGSGREEVEEEKPPAPSDVEEEPLLPEGVEERKEPPAPREVREVEGWEGTLCFPLLSTKVKPPESIF